MFSKTFNILIIIIHINTKTVTKKIPKYSGMSRRIDWFLVTDASKVRNTFFSVSSPKAIGSLEMSIILCQSIRHGVPRGFNLQRQGR